MKKVRNDAAMKVIIVGDLAVGKTSILNQFDKQTFDENVENTIGAAFVNRYVDTSYGPVNLRIWDTAGQERYKSLIPMYARDAAAAIVVVDITNPGSYESLEMWVDTVKEHALPRCKIYIAANKMDLELKIPLDRLEMWSNQRSYPLFKTCASVYETVEPLFMKVAEEMGTCSEETKRGPIIERREDHTTCC